jgi:2'-5' RNA ligase
MRCLVALEPGADARDRIRAARAEWEARFRGWRFLEPDHVHLTVKFLGEALPEVVAGLAGDLQSACAVLAPVRFRLAGLGAFPTRGTPRVLWIGALDAGGEGRLRELAALVDEVAGAHGWAAETRGFHPHLTVARARRGVRPSRPTPETPFDGGVVEARSVVLFESELRPGGSRYLERARFPLDGTAEETAT